MTVKQRRQQLRCRVAVLILILFDLNVILACNLAECLKGHVEQPAIEVTEETEDIIRWKEDEEQISVEPLESFKTKESAVQSLGEFKLTAYCSCTECSGKWGDLISTGGRAVEGRTVAVDPSVIPYGTVLIININNQWHEYVAEDCGEAVKGKIIDIYFDTHEEAENFRQYADVYVKEE